MSTNNESNPNLERLEKYLSDRSKDFFVDTLKYLAIPYNLLEFPCTREKVPSTGYYMSPDKNGDIRFFTPDMTGQMECYTTDTTNVKVHDWYMTRFQVPRKTKDGEAKYMPVTGGGTRLLITKPLLDALKSKKAIDTLYMVEGFKKAHAMAFHGNLPVIGMNGLTGFKEPMKDKIRTELKDIILLLSVKKTVICYDSDLFELGKSKDDPETTRPNIFFRAAIAAKTFIEPFCDVVLVHPNPHPDKKLGFDDLLFESRKNEFTTQNLYSLNVIPDPGHAEVFKALKNALSDKKNELFSVLKLSSVTDHKIKEYFHLDDVNSFYNFYRDALKSRLSFRYYTRRYKVREDGTPEEHKDESWGYYQKEGLIWKRASGKDKDDQFISNFSFEILFHIKGDENKRVARLTNNLKELAIIEITGEDLASPQRFTALCISQGNFIFRGSKDDLLLITSMLLKHERAAIVFSCLGYQPLYGVYAFANGIATTDGWKPCDDYGIIEHNDQYFYFPAYSKFNESKIERFADERKYIHVPGEKVYSFEQWKEQFVKVYGDNGEVVCCYYLAALFSDIVFNHRSGIRFPLLFASGKPKTGKSTIFISLLHLFGEGLIGESLTSNSTFKFLFTQLAKVRNGIVFFDEFSDQLAKIFEFLKNIFDRRPYGTKQFSNDTKTRITPVLSALCVSGEMLPTGNHALFTRTISLMFNRTIDQRTDAEKENLSVLSRMEENGLTSITVTLSKFRHLVEKQFDTTLTVVEKDLNRAFRGLPVDGRMIKSAAGILAVVRVLTDNNAIDYQTEWDELLKIWVRILTAQNQQIQTNTDAAKFWEIMEQLIREGKISEDSGDYRFDSGYFILRINRIIQPYQKRALELKYSKVLDKPTLKNYLENEPYYSEMLNSDGTPKQVRFAGSAPTSAIWIDYEMLQRIYQCDLSSTTDKDWKNDPEELSKVGAPGLQKTLAERLTSTTPEAEQNDLPF